MDWDDLKTWIAVIGVMIILVAWLVRRIRVRSARHWPMAEGTVESGVREVVFSSKYGNIELPVFAFSYRVARDYYSGCFALRPYITDPGESVIDRLIGRKLQVRYNPTRPSVWFIPDELIEGCRVEQKLDPHLVSYPPRD